MPSEHEAFGMVVVDVEVVGTDDASVLVSLFKVDVVLLETRFSYRSQMLLLFSSRQQPPL